MGNIICRDIICGIGIFLSNFNILQMSILSKEIQYHIKNIIWDHTILDLELLDTETILFVLAT
jgi:hypothetical protein